MLKVLKLRGILIQMKIYHTSEQITFVLQNPPNKSHAKETQKTERLTPEFGILAVNFWGSTFPET